MDETALLMAPLVKRTWAPVGETPQLNISMGSRRKLSVIGALIVDLRTHRVEFAFQILSEANVDAQYFRSFLHALSLTLGERLMVILDNLAVHKASGVRDLIRRHRPRITPVYLPSYAPELNPVEYVWTEMKYHTLSNYSPKTLKDLEHKAVSPGMKMALEPDTLRSCLDHSPLDF